MGKLLDILTLLFLSVSCSVAFRFNDDSEFGRPTFGEAGFNAVPRIGRRSLGSNPFDSRFRFRFNNLASAYGGRMGSNAGFRFQGGDDAPNYQLRKRMAESVSLDKKEQERQATDDPEDLAAFGQEQEIVDPEQDIRDGISGLQLADKYWREYISDMAKILAAENKAVIDENPALMTPLQKYLLRNQTPEKPIFKTNMFPFIRGNY